MLRHRQIVTPLRLLLCPCYFPGQYFGTITILHDNEAISMKLFI